MPALPDPDLPNSAVILPSTEDEAVADSVPVRIRTRTAWHHIAFGANTARIFVRQWLPESGEALPGKKLIAFHGLTGTGADFEFLARQLAAAGWHVICPDLPGHGRSSQFGDFDAYGISKVVHLFLAIFEIYAKKEPVSVLGASWGGGATGLFLNLYQIRVQSLIINDVALEFDPYLNRYTSFLKTEARRRFATRADARHQLMMRNHVLFRQCDERKIAPAVLLRHLDSRIRQSKAGFRFNYDPAFMQRGTLVHVNYPNYHDIIASIPAERVLLLYGEHSPFKNSDTVLRLSMRPNFRYAEIPDAGHAPRLLTRYETNLVREFLEGQPLEAAAPGVSAASPAPPAS